jgi:golgin subfamily B member 1
VTQQGGSQSVSDRLARCVEEARWSEAFSFACWLAWAETDEAKAASAWRRAAEIAQVNLGKLPEAEQCLTRLLELRPRDPSGLEQMALILETKGTAEAAGKLWERLAEVDGERAPACLARAAELYEKRVGAPAKAIACLRHLLALQPKDVGARDRLFEVLVGQRRFQAAADLLDRPDLSGPLDRADLIAGLGTRLLDEPIEHPLAKRCFERAIQLAPAHAAGLEGLHKLQELTTGWQQLVRSLRATAVEERDRRAAATLYLRIAQLHAAYDPNGPTGVQENLQRCFLLWPGMSAALETLERLAQHWGDPGWAVRGLEALAAAARDRTVAADLWERCARIMLAEPAGRGRSVAALEKAVELDPSRPASAWLLAEVFLEEGQAGAAAEVLEHHVDKLPRSSVEPRLYLADLLLRKLREPARAKAQLESVLRVPPETLDGLRRLAELCERLEDPELIAQVLDLLASAEPRRQRRLEWLDRLADIHDRATRPRQAFRAAAEALWLQPGQKERFERVARIAHGAGLREELETALERTFAIAQLPAEVAMIGKALAAAVEEPARRVAILKEVLTVQPGDREASAALEESLLRSGSAQDLEAELRRRVAGAENAQVRLEQMRNLARLVERREASADELAELYRALVALDPEDLEATRKLLQAETALGRWPAAEEALRKLLAKERDPVRAVDLQQELAIVLVEKVGKGPEAVGLLKAVLAARPGRPAALRLLGLLLADPVAAGPAAALAQEEYGRLGDWAQALALLERRIAAAAASERVELRAEQARIQEEKLVDRRGAFSTLCLAVKEGDGAGVLEGLLRLARDLGHVAEACAALLEAAVVVPPERGLSLARAAGRLASDAGDAERFLEAQQCVLRLAPDDPEALEACARQAQAKGKAEEAVTLLRRQLAAGKTKEERAGRLLQIARLLAGELQRSEEAAEAFRAALKEGAEPQEVLGPLAEALLNADRAKDAVEVLNKEVALWEKQNDVAHATRARLRKARILDQDLGDPTAAVAEYSEVLARRPNAPEALDGLEAMLGGSARRQAAEVLVKVHETNQDPQRLVLALEAIADAETQPEKRAAVLKRIAEVQVGALREPALAFATLARAVRLRPKDYALRAEIGKIAAAAELVPDFVALLEELVAGLRGPQAAPLLLELGQLDEGPLQDPARAQQRYTQALEAAPGSLAVLQALYRLAQKHGGAERLVSAAEALAAVTKDAGQKVALLREAASSAIGVKAEALWKELLQIAPEDELAIQALERLFAQAGPDQEWAGTLLVPVYERRGDSARLVLALEVQAPRGAKPADRAAIWSKAAALRESLGQAPQAFAARLHALRNNPGDTKLAEAIERQAVSLGVVEELVAAYEDILGAVDPAAPEQPILLGRLAALVDSRLGRPERAVELYASLVARVPGQVAVLQRLAELDRQLARYTDLIGVLRLQIQHFSAEPGKRKELFFEIASLLEGPLGDQDGAMAAYREILAIDPSDPAALEKLGRLLGDAKRWDELAKLLGQVVQKAEAEGAREDADGLRLRLGAIRAQHLGDPAGALECFGAVLKRSPENATAFAGVEQLLAGATRAEDRTAAARLLDPIYRTRKNLTALAQSLQVQAETTVGPEQVKLLLELANLYATQLASPELAFTTAGKALRADPQNADALAAAMSAAERGGFAEELADLLAELVPTVQDPEVTRRIHWALARIYQLALADLSRAAAEWKKVLEIAPDDAEAFEALLQLLSQSGDYASLLELLRRQLAMAEAVERRVLLLHRIGEIQQDQQKDANGAFTTYRRLVELAPEDRKALARLDVLCVRQERWPELAPVLEQEARLSAAANELPAQASFLFRLGQLREGPLGDPEAALALYRAVLEAQPGHPETVARLEKILEQDPQNVVAAELLEGVHQASRDWPKYAAALDARASATPDPQARRDVLLELARVREKHQGRADLAFIALCRAFKDDAADPQLRADLERVADLAETHEELIGVYEEELERSGAPEVMAPLMLKVGELLDQKSGDADKALTYYEKAHELDPKGTQGALPALERLYRQKERWDRLADVLDELAALAAEPADKVSLLFRLGQLSEERLAAPDRAARAYEALLTHDAAHLPTLRALERLYEAAGRGADLFAVLEKQRSLTPEGQARDRIIARMADVASSQLQDDAKAADLWKDLIARNPRAENAQAGLEGVLERLERWQELADLLQARLKNTVDPREITRLNDRLGWVMGVKLGKADEAARSFRAVLERDPKNRRALEALRDIHLARGEKEELAAVLRRLIPLQEDAAGVKTIRLQLAQALAGLGRREEAIEAARRALDLEPHTIEELVKAEAIFRELSAWPECLRAMEGRAELLAADQPAEALATWFAVADLHTQALKRPEGGAPALEKILERDPSSEKAAAALEQIYSKTGDWRRYAALLDRLSHQAPEPERRLQLLKQLAQIQEQRLGQKDMAFLALCRAFQLDPQDKTVAVTMRRLAKETGAIEELAAVYESVADSAGRGADAEQVYLNLARIQDEDLDDAEAAEASLRKWLTLEPTSLAAVEQLGGLFKRRGRSREHALALEQRVNIVGTLEEKKLALRELAACYEEMGETAEAVTSLQRGLELDSGDVALTQELGAIYRREKAWPDLVGLLQKARDQASEDPQRSALQLQIAEITEQGLVDDEAAISAYRMALELDPVSMPALVALERIYSKLDRAAELLHVYDRQAEVVEPRERIKVLFKAAQVWEEKLGNPTNAIACLEGVLDVEPHAVKALKDLERLYRQAGDGEHLASTLQRRLAVAVDAAETVALHVILGEVWNHNLNRPDQAEQLFQRALQIDPNNQPALHALGELYERSGNWQQALEMLGREGRLGMDTAQAVDLHFRSGRIYAEMLQDIPRATAEFDRCLEVDPGHLPSLQALKQIYADAKNHGGYLEMARREAEVTTDPAQKTELYYALGKFYQDVQEDVAGAERSYLEALRWTPNHQPSARPLADIYQSRSDWQNAEKMLDIVVAGSQGDPKDLCRQYYRLGYVTDKLQKADKALDAYRHAYELDATYLPALEGLGHLLVQTQGYDEALRIYQAILIHHRDDLTDLEVVEIHWQIGAIHRNLGQPERAQKDFEKALELDASHEPSHQALVEIFEAGGQYDAALEHRQKLLETLEGEPRFAMCVGIAKLARDHLGDPYQAIDAYLQALKIVPAGREALESLLALYVETKQSQKAVEMLERLLALPEVQKDLKTRKQLHLKLALVYRDEVKDEGKAMAQFNLALDADPMFIDAFAALETMLTARRSWPELEQSYHAMIKRLPKTPETNQARMALWRNLGELYRRALKNVDGAIMAYEVVSKGEPNDGQVVELLADLYGAKPGLEGKAIEAHRAALRSTAQPARNVKALARLHAARKEYDEAYITSQVAVHLLGDRDPDEEQVVERLKRYARETANRSMTDRLWTEHVYHERLRGPMAEVLAICQDATAGAFAVDHGRLNVNPKRDRVDVAQSMLFFANMYKYVARAFSMEAAELFKIPGISGLALGNTWPICFLASEDMFKDRPKKELWFAIAKAMAFSRPELAMARLHPPEELEAIFQAALYLAVPTFRPTADPQELQKQGRKLEKGLSETARPALFRAARECLKDPNQTELRGYIEAVEHTANRAGILLCADVEVAKRCLAKDPGVAARLPERSKVRDLMLFCLSSNFFSLRKALGLSIEIPTEGRAAS